MTRDNMTYEVVAHEPPARLVARLTHKYVTSTETWSVTAAPDGPGSVVAYRSAYAFHGLARVSAPFGPVVMRLSGDDMRRRLQGRLDALARP